MKLHGFILFKAASSMFFATLGLALILLATIPSAKTAQAGHQTRVAGNAPVLPITLQLRWHHQFQFAGYYAAKEKGFYRDAGFDVTIVAGAPGRKPINEVLAGRAQFGTANSEVLLRRLKGQPLVALAAIFQHSAMILLAREDSGIRSPHDLPGRKVMSTGDAEILSMLRGEGIDPGRVDFQESSYDIGDLVAGKTDAFNAYLTNEPYFMNQKGIPYITLKPITYGIDFYSDILFTMEKETRDHPELVNRFREASLRGWRYALENPDEIIDLIKTEYGSTKTIDHLRFEADAMRQLVLPGGVEIGYMNPGRWKHMADTFVREGMVDPGYSLQGFIYDPNAPKDLLVFLGPKYVQPYASFENGKPIGAYVDLTNALGKILGHPVEVRLYPWADAQVRVRRGEGHALIAMVINEKRKELYDFTQSTFAFDYMLFIKSQHIGAFDVRDLSNKRIAVRRGGYALSIIENNHPEAETVFVKTILEGFQMLLKGKIDGVLDERLIGHNTLKKNKIQGIDALQTPLSKRTLHIPIPKGNSALLGELNEAISKLKSAGKIKAISRRWLGGPVFFLTRSERNAALIGGAMTLAVVAMLAIFLFFTVAKRNRERTMAEGQLKASLAEKEVLLREVHHRVKNNLQVISSMLSLQAGGETDNRSLEALEDSQRRVMVMARIHEKLHQSDDLTSINAREYLNAVLEDTIASGENGAQKISSRLIVDDIIINIDHAVACGQIISELVSNSLKHAFPNGQSGNIEVSMHRREGGKIELSVADDGKGFPEGLDFKKSKTLGLRLIDALAMQLNGEVNIDGAGGARVKITFPEKRS